MAQTDAETVTGAQRHKEREIERQPDTERQIQGQREGETDRRRQKDIFQEGWGGGVEREGERVRERESVKYGDGEYSNSKK